MKKVIFNLSNKIILDLCGGTGAWSKPYRDAGYDVRLITLPDNDVRTYIPPDGVHGVLAAPPCTIFSLAGNKYRFQEKKDHTYIPKLIEGLQLVQDCLDIIKKAKPKWWVLENPVGTLSNFLGEPYMMFDPCDFGDPYTKRTALWGNFTAPFPENRVVPEFVTLKSGKKMSPVHAKTGGRSEKTKEIRSITPQGFAKAFFEANR